MESVEEDGMKAVKNILVSVTDLRHLFEDSFRSPPAVEQGLISGGHFLLGGCS